MMKYTELPTPIAMVTVMSTDAYNQPACNQPAYNQYAFNQPAYNQYAFNQPAYDQYARGAYHQSGTSATTKHGGSGGLCPCSGCHCCATGLFLGLCTDCLSGCCSGCLS